MATFESTVLALNPLLFWRCKDLTGDRITDYSGNDHHGDIVASVLLGGRSLIETEADARSVYNDEDFASNIAQIASPPAALLFTGNFSIGCFAAHDLTVGTQYLFGRAGIANSTVTGLHLKTIGASGSRTPLAHYRTWDGSTSHLVEVTAGSSLPVGATCFYVLTRNGSVARLYNNGVLVGETTGGDTNPLKIESSNKLVFGSAANNLAPLVGYGAELMIFDYALSASQVLAIHESSRLVLPLRATIIINLGIELNTDQIVPADLPFAHNYSSTFGNSHIPIVEELEYQTNVNQSEPDYQQRINARPHGPLRSLEYHLSPASSAARSRLQGALYTPAQHYAVPVWSDAGVTTGLAASGTNTISCDTTKRDYQALSYCGICTDPSDPFTYEFRQISAVADAQLTLTSNLGASFPTGSLVFPARVASISEDHFAVKSFAADHEDTIIRFEVLESELSTRRITAYTPSTTYKSHEVFTLESAKVSFLDERPYDARRRIQTQGRDYQFAKDTGSPQTFPVRFLLTTRTQLSEFLGWLDNRQGKQNPLFVSTGEHDYTALARPTSTTLTVRKAGFSFHHGRRHLEILKTDGSFSRVKLTGITDNLDNTETLTSADSLPTFNTITRVSFLKFCTLGSDSARLHHFKGGSAGQIISDCSLSFTELLTSPA